ncbi:MAG: amino acid ABC transporter permease, partial [Rhodospirillales bacterium]|nr:amino acid ABC transporter permease [Rhodospirillales bacterium]
MEATLPAAATPARERPPVGTTGAVGWLRANLFGSWWSTAVTLLLGYLLLRWAWGFIGWGVVGAIWSVPQTAHGPDPTSCRMLRGAGACWAVIGDKARFVLFGQYPYAQQWRPALCVLLFIALYAISANRRFWRRELLYLWVGALAAIFALMWGGFAGLTLVADDQWGGLPITLLLSTFGLAAAFPLAVLVALGRRSRELPVVRLLCILYVELIRGVPLISLLFMASVMFPLFMPEGMNPDKLLRAQV